jgi:hypothetical protein
MHSTIRSWNIARKRADFSRLSGAISTDGYLITFSNLGDAPAQGSITGATGNANLARVIPIAVTSTNAAGGVNAHIGRNDACPCGSTKKWKKCGLLNTEEHRLNMTKKGSTPPTHEVTGG